MLSQCSKLRFYFRAPATCLCVTHYETYSKVGKSMHTPGAQVSKSMHPAAKMCTQGAGCTLNFENCFIYAINSRYVDKHPYT